MHLYIPLLSTETSSVVKRLSFSSMGSKDGIYEEIKEHLRLNKPLGAAVYLLLEPCRPTADISLCHSHHSNVVISPICSAVMLTNTHAPSTCTHLLFSPVISPMLFVLMTGIHLECDIFILFLLYIITFLVSFSFRPGKIQWGS